MFVVAELPDIHHFKPMIHHLCTQFGFARMYYTCLPERYDENKEHLHVRSPSPQSSERYSIFVQSIVNENFTFAFKSNSKVLKIQIHCNHFLDAWKLFESRRWSSIGLAYLTKVWTTVHVSLRCPSCCFGKRQGTPCSPARMLRTKLARIPLRLVCHSLETGYVA